MYQYLAFEDDVAKLDAKIEDLRHLNNEKVGIADEISHLQQKSEKLLTSLYSRLTPWQKTLVARHPQRPKFNDYLHGLFTDFQLLSGDRLYHDDQSTLGGLARFDGIGCVVIGQEKGSTTAQRVAHNFGMAMPEGYRKAQRLIAMADQFQLPIITFIDTPGAFPGIEAEQRGQAEAIAQSIQSCLRANVPMISVIIGEGGSGGAIAIATTDRVLMLEFSVYSVISPEGCASILWRSADMAEDAANMMKLTAQDLKELKIIDNIIKEPLGGAHRDKEMMIATLKEVIAGNLKQLLDLQAQGEDLLNLRHQRYLQYGL